MAKHIQSIPETSTRRKSDLEPIESILDRVIKRKPRLQREVRRMEILRIGQTRTESSDAA